jgi:hypothetical protein
MPKPARRLYRVKTRHWHDRSQRQTEVSGKPALLVFERRKGTDVVDAMLFVKRRNWFGAHNFSAAGRADRRRIRRDLVRKLSASATSP